MDATPPDAPPRASNDRAARGVPSVADASESGEPGASGEFASKKELLLRPRGALGVASTADALPEGTAAEFARYRRRDLMRYLKVAPVALAIFTLLITSLQSSRLFGILDARDTRLWLWSASLTCFVVCAATAATRLAFVRERYEWLAAPAGTAVLAKLIVMPYAFTNLVAATSESYFCAFGVFIVTVGLRLRLAVARVSVVAAVVLASAIVPFVAVRPIDWLAVAYCVFAPSVVGLFVASQLEEKDKIGFLQELLLAHQSKELHRLAHADALSGLANRREFDRRLNDEWARLGQEHRSLSVVFVDLDHFKAFNDYYGHAAGDEVIAATGAAIAAATARVTDLAARYGGEEFVLLLPETDRAGAETVAARVLDGIRGLRISHAASPVATILTASVGVATTIPSARTSAIALVEEADHALYAAKSAGRDRIRVAGIRSSSASG